jgi:hypothetical protein
MKRSDLSERGVGNYAETLNMVDAQSAGMHRSYLRIGDVSIGLCADCADDVELTQEMNRFRTTPARCDVNIRVQWMDRLPKPEGRKLFDSGAVWVLHETGDGYVFDFATPMLGEQPYKRLSVDKEFSKARVLLNREYFREGRWVCPLEYPLDELLVTNWLARNGGVEVHGCGLRDDSTGGQLFLGHSGAGKSTTARLWRSLRAACVLSDDRIILREESNEIWMHGTPWHGEAGFAAPEKTQVNKIFVLEHGNRNELLPIPQARAVAEMFARCFPPFYSQESLAFTFSFLQRITNRVPCYLFRFVPDESAVGEILNFRD